MQFSSANKSCFLQELWCNDVMEHNYKGVKTGVKKIRKQVNKNILYEKVVGI